MISNKVNIDDRIKVKKQADLLDLPKIVTVNKFTEESVAKFSKDLNDAIDSNQEIIPIVIDSYGGYVYSLLAMIDILEACDKTIATIAVGKSMSCGSILLSCGTDGHRYVSPNATVMIHDVSNSTWGKAEDLKVSVNESERLKKLIFAKMARNCGHADDEYFIKIIHSKLNTDWFLNSKECVEHNLANHIKLPKFSVDVDVKIKFG